jgi:hypothetical protein
MRLKREFYKLPLRFDVARLVEEVSGFAEEEWREHPQKFPGNSAMVLISARGEINDEMDGPMAATEKLHRCPYLQQVLSSFETVFGRSRLMRLAPGAEVSLHNDVHYYWRNRVRIHIPIVTDPAVRFFCGKQSVHMAAGEAWIFDNWKPHRVINPSAIHRIHLVADTVGTSAFWERVRELHLSGHREPEPRFVPYQPELRPVLSLERYNQSTVMTPVELDTALREMIFDLRRNRQLDPYQCGAFVQVLDELRHEWQALWVQHGPEESGWPAYREQLQRARARMAVFPKSLTLASTGYPVQDAVEAILQACLGAVASQSGAGSVPLRSGTRRVAGPRYDRPVFIIAAPRSGSTLLFEALAENRAFWTLGDESHRQFEGIAALHPHARGYDSNRLQVEDASDEIAGRLYEAFRADLCNAQGTRYLDLPVAERPGSLRFLEKTPKNALRIPFLRALFPDARFIYLYRNPRDNLSSLLDSWRSGRFRTYPGLPGWTGEPWSHLLIPGWQELIGKPLAEIVAAQWRITHEIILQDLAGVPESDWELIAYETLLGDTAGEIERLCRFCEVPFGPHMRTLVTQPLRHSRYTLTMPDTEKWRANAAELDVALPLVADVGEHLAEILALRPVSAGSRAEASN